MPDTEIENSNAAASVEAVPGPQAHTHTAVVLRTQRVTDEPIGEAREAAANGFTVEPVEHLRNEAPLMPVGSPIQLFDYRHADQKNNNIGPGPYAAMVTQNHGDGICDVVVFAPGTTYHLDRLPFYEPPHENDPREPNCPDIFWTVGV